MTLGRKVYISKVFGETEIVFFDPLTGFQCQLTNPGSVMVKTWWKKN